MAKYRYLENAFWERDDRTLLKCIRMTELGEGREKKDILSIPKYNEDKSENEQYKEVVKALSAATIDRYTAKRKADKKREQAERNVKREQDSKAKDLERLFQLKLRAFEIEEIKNSKNKELRTRLRKAKNEIELNAFTTILLAKELNVFGQKWTSEEMHINKPREFLE